MKALDAMLKRMCVDSKGWGLQMVVGGVIEGSWSHAICRMR
jgi:hypothetical protein